MHKQEFYSRLEAAFQPENREDLQELWEHLSEQIDNMDQASLSIDGIIETLGSPEDIAREFYLDLNIQTALTADKGVIPSELAEEIAGLKKRLKFISRAEKLFGWLLAALRILIALAAGYFAVYVLQELIVEGRLSAGALVCLLSAGLMTYALWPRRKHALPLLGGALALACLGLWALGAANLLLYRGHTAAWDWTVAGGTKNISIKSDIPLDIAIDHSNDDNLHIRLDGKTTRQVGSQLDSLQPDGEGVELVLSEGALFRLFTDTPQLNVIISIPKSNQPEGININANKAGVLMEGQGGSISVHLSEGHIVMNGTLDADLQLYNAQGDTILQQQRGCSVSIESDSGRIILKDNEDINTVIQSEDCFIRLQDTSCENADIRNASGKTVLEDTAFSQLRLESDSGDVVAIRQSGQSSIVSNSGSLVLKLLQGRLDVDNPQGSTIVSQDIPLDASIETGTGLIRWEQRGEGWVDFRITGGNDENVNQFEDQPGQAEAVVELVSGDGPIKVFKGTQAP